MARGLAVKPSEELRQLRTAIGAKRPRRVPGSERRVYVLPPTMLARILRFQLEAGMPSETEAARKLMEVGLKAWEALRG